MLRALAAGALRQAKQQGSSPLSLGPYRAVHLSQARHLGSSVAGVGELRVEGRSAGLCTGLTPGQQTRLSSKSFQLLRPTKAATVLQRLKAGSRWPMLRAITTARQIAGEAQTVKEGEGVEDPSYEPVTPYQLYVAALQGQMGYELVSSEDWYIMQQRADDYNRLREAHPDLMHDDILKRMTTWVYMDAFGSVKDQGVLEKLLQDPDARRAPREEPLSPLDVLDMRLSVGYEWEDLPSLVKCYLAERAQEYNQMQKQKQATVDRAESVFSLPSLKDYLSWSEHLKPVTVKPRTDKDHRVLAEYAIAKEREYVGLRTAHPTLSRATLLERVTSWRSFLKERYPYLQLRYDAAGKGVYLHDITGDVKTGAPAQAHAQSDNHLDLTELARKGKLKPVIGRDAEIRQCLLILSKSTQNSVMLVGEDGVGKASVVRGLAHRFAAGDVPKELKGYRVLHLNVPKAYHDKYNEYDEDRENEDDESDEDEDCEDEECDDEDGEHEGIYHYSHINAQYAVLPPGVEMRHGCK